MEINLVAESVKFLILGMSTVFMFLVLMVFVLEIQSKIIMRFFPQKKEEIFQEGVSSRAQQSNVAVIAAIAASVKLHKQSK